MSAGMDTPVHEITYHVSCPYCGYEHDIRYDVDEIKPNPYNDNFNCKGCTEKFYVRKD